MPGIIVRRALGRQTSPDEMESRAGPRLGTAVAWYGGCGRNELLRRSFNPQYEGNQSMLLRHLLLATGAAIAVIGVSTPCEAQDRITQRPRGTQANQREQNGATRNSAQIRRNGTGPTVKEAILKKLHKANEAEIELAKMAQQRSSSSEVKQLAQTIIRDHQALNSELEVCLDGKDEHHGGTSTADRSNPKTADHATRNSRLATDRSPAKTVASNRDRQAAHGSNATATVPQELCELGERACDNALEMTKKMLDNYRGQDFDMAFLGQQLVAHTMMLAELQAIQSSGPKELRAIAGKAIDKVTKHRGEAQKLAKRLEDDRATAGG